MKNFEKFELNNSEVIFGGELVYTRGRTDIVDTETLELYPI